MHDDTLQPQVTDEEALRQFLLDIECLDQLSKWTNRFNIFDVLKITRTEIRHSNMLAWLLDPNENHGLDDTFLRAFIQKIVEKYPEQYEVFEYLLMDFSSFSVIREWNDIDILIVSEKENAVFAIENKVDSSEHSNQLDKYSTILDVYYGNYKKRCLWFLTPDGIDSEDSPDWTSINYDIVLSCLELINTSSLNNSVSCLIQDYIEIVRRDIVENQEIIKICNDIYKKHRKALDLIYTYRTDLKMHIYNAVSNLSSEQGIIYKPDNRSNHFGTTSMNRIIQSLGIEYNAQCPQYNYEIIINNSPGKEELSIRLVFYKDKYPQLNPIIEKLDDIINAKYNTRNRSNDTKRFKTIYTTSKQKFTKKDDWEQASKEAVTISIAEIKEIESWICEKLNIDK